MLLPDIAQGGECSRKKILFVMNSAKYFVLNRLPLAIEAIANGYEVYIAAPCDDVESVRKLVSIGIRFIPFHLSRKGINPTSSLKSAYHLFNIIQRVKPDLVQSYTIKAVVLSGLICRYLHIPMVALIPGKGIAFTTEGFKGQCLSILGRNLYRISLSSNQCCACFQHEEDRKFFEQLKVIDFERSYVVGNAVDTELFTFSPPRSDSDSPVFMLGGRMLYNKGVVEFIEASKLVRKQFPNVRFRLIGGIDAENPFSIEENELTSLCRNADVKWLGHCTDMPASLGECDIFCLPTYYPEGIPKTLLQAASMGKGLITTDIPGCREVVKHEETGLLVSPRDVDGLAEGMIRFIESPDLLQKCSCNSRKLIEQNFAGKIIHDRYLEIYRDYCKERSN